MTKVYDRKYFDHWYRNPAHRIGSTADLERAVTLAVAMAEMVLERPVDSVLDIGAGEGRWQPVLGRLRPGASYLGVEPSEWAVSHWGARRNLLRGDLDNIHQLGIGGPADLVICADVLHYLPTPQLKRGLLNLAPFIGGVAFCPTFTSEDSIDGDREGFQSRRADSYRQAFENAGLYPIGMHVWIPRDLLPQLAALERATAR